MQGKKKGGGEIGSRTHSSLKELFEFQETTKPKTPLQIKWK